MRLLLVAKTFRYLGDRKSLLKKSDFESNSRKLFSKLCDYRLYKNSHRRTRRLSLKYLRFPKLVSVLRDQKIAETILSVA